MNAREREVCKWRKRMNAREQKEWQRRREWMQENENNVNGEW